MAPSSPDPTAPTDGGATVPVLVASPLEEELAALIGQVDPRVELLYDAALLPRPRYVSDHRGEDDFRRDEAGERRFREWLERSEVVFGVPGETPEGFGVLVDGAPRLRWVQATSAGAGEALAAAGLAPDVLERVTFTKANGVHAGPLAEFSLFGLLAVARDLPRLTADRAARRWDHWPTRELRGRTVLVVGLGEIGLEVARLAAAFGMRVLGVKRDPTGDYPHVERVAGTDALVELAAEADAMVVTLPMTDATRELVDADVLRALRPGATLVNVGRGGVVDEDELVAALVDGHLAGAVLDVTREEPLPPDSPLWTLPNVVLSPHTAALVPEENERIVAQFTANLRRLLDGEPLTNRIDTTSFY